jgi:hypothetical protein
LLAPEALNLVEELLRGRDVRERERLRPYAEEVAAAEMELMRVRSVGRVIWTEFASGGEGPWEPRSGSKPSRKDLLEALERLERYDRRALSRRKRAIRDFSQATLTS